MGMAAQNPRISYFVIPEQRFAPKVGITKGPPWRTVGIALGIGIFGQYFRYIVDGRVEVGEHKVEDTDKAIGSQRAHRGR
ncbi:MAG: hypothetical protein DRI44_09895 [Chlamydiae bacterium]|nr:MAG: hypothetical protein DRI44_09895 [Chlamydiota bacterium]